MRDIIIIIIIIIIIWSFLGVLVFIPVLLFEHQSQHRSERISGSSPFPTDKLPFI